MFRLQLLETARIYPVFHVSQLKLAIRTQQVKGYLPVELQVEGPVCWPLRVLQRRTKEQHEDMVPQVLIEWQEGGKEGATWEDELTIKEQFLEFNLEDKVDLVAVGNDRVLKVYERRKRN